MTPVAIVAIVGLFTGGATAALLAQLHASNTASCQLWHGVFESTLSLHPRLVRPLLRKRQTVIAVRALPLVTIAVVVIAIASVGVILVMVRTRTGIAQTDFPAAEWAAEQQTDFATSVLRAVTRLGSTSVLAALALLVSALTVRNRSHVASIGFLGLIIGGQSVLVNGIKHSVDRARPDVSQLSGFSGPSVPSGHAAAAAACFACFALVLSLNRARPVRILLWSVATGAAASVAATRVLLGVHWLTDVIAGVLLGWAWCAFCFLTFGGWLLRWGSPLRPANPVAKHDPEGRHKRA